MGGLERRAYTPSPGAASLPPHVLILQIPGNKGFPQGPKGSAQTFTGDPVSRWARRCWVVAGLCRVLIMGGAPGKQAIPRGSRCLWPTSFQKDQPMPRLTTGPQSPPTEEEVTTPTPCRMRPCRWPGRGPCEGEQGGSSGGDPHLPWVWLMEHMPALLASPPGSGFQADGGPRSGKFNRLQPAIHSCPGVNGQMFCK